MDFIDQKLCRSFSLLSVKIAMCESGRNRFTVD